MKNLLYIFICFAVVSCAVLMKTDRVERVIDGDTIVLTTGERIRFARIDTPELDTRKGKRVAKWLRNRIEGKKVKIVRKGKGYYGRTIGEVYYQGVNLNDQLLETGRAVKYKK